MATSTKTRKSTPRKTLSTTASSKNPSTTEKPLVGAIEKPQSKVGATPKLMSSPDPVVSQADLKKKELIDLVVERSGIKKKDAKPVVEAMLAVLGETIAEGRELNLQPLGKLRINRAIDKGNGRVIICKLRQSVPGKGEAKDDAKDVSEDDVKDGVAEATDKL